MHIPILNISLRLLFVKKSELTILFDPTARLFVKFLGYIF